MDYTLGYLKSRLNAKIKNKIGIIIDQNALVNEAVDFIVGRYDFVSHEREVTLTGPIDFLGTTTYNAPDEDIKDMGIISLTPVDYEGNPQPYELTHQEEFYARGEHGMITQLPDGSFRVHGGKTTGDHVLKYYSKLPWVSEDGQTRKSQADTNTDILLADKSEIRSYLYKLNELGADEIDETNLSDRYAARFTDEVDAYMMLHPSRAMILTTTYREHYA